MRNISLYRPGRPGFYNDFDRMVSSVFNSPVINKPVVKAGGSPSVDIREEKDSYQLEAEVPGLTEKDIEIQVKENLLTLSSRVEENKGENGGYLLRERKTVNFKRSFILPKDVDQEKIEARYGNGVLTLSLPKKPETKPKTIDVKIQK